jgi:hypothetical protein
LSSLLRKTETSADVIVINQAKQVLTRLTRRMLSPAFPAEEMQSLAKEVVSQPPMLLSG